MVFVRTRSIQYLRSFFYRPRMKRVHCMIETLILPCAQQVEQCRQCDVTKVRIVHRALYPCETAIQQLECRVYGFCRNRHSLGPSTSHAVQLQQVYKSFCSASTKSTESRSLFNRMHSP